MGGCNSSTKEDVKKDRERTRAGERGNQQQNQQQQQSQSQQNASGDRARGTGGAQIPKPGSGGPSSAQGMPPGSYRDSQGIPRSHALDQPISSSFKPGSVHGGGAGHGGAYGTSYTNRKTKEYDLLNDIVKQTRSNFIDVSAKAGALDEDDLLERGQKYVKNLSEIPTTAHSLAQSAAQAANSFGIYLSAMDLPSPCAAVVKRAVPSSNASGLASGLASAPSRMTGEVDYAALVALLSGTAVTATTPQDLEFAATSAAQIAAALNDNTTVQEPPPHIVLTYEELLK